MYTKGPWEVKSATFTEKGVAFEVIMSEQVICAGDAKLIEAAPAMHEALKRIATKLESWGKSCLSGSEEDTLQEANQAIAKVISPKDK